MRDKLLRFRFAGRDRSEQLSRYLTVAGTLLLVVIVVLSSSAAFLGMPAVSRVAHAQETATESGDRGNTTNASDPAVTFTNQTTATGANVTVRSATLPEGGFVAIHGSGYKAGITEMSLVAVSRYLEPGSYQNLTIPVDAEVPGGYRNQTKFNGTQNVTARLYKDTNDNQRFDYLLSSNDSGYQVDSDSVAESARVVVEGTRGSRGWKVPTASVTIDDQRSDGTSVTIQRAKLPSGGFLVIHDSRYLPPENDTFGSVIGVSRYLDSNETATTVEVTLFDVPGRSFDVARLRNDSTLVVRPSRDTNNNQQYDFLESKGIEDSPYTNTTNTTNGSEVVIERADIEIVGSENATSTTNGSTNGSTNGTSGEPVDVDLSGDTDQGVLGEIARLLDGPLFDLFIGAAFIVFVIIFVMRLRGR